MKIIISLLSIAISVALFFTISEPFYVDVKELKKGISTYTTALENSTELQTVKDSLIEEYNGITQENIQKLESFLPSSIGNIGLILEIEKIADNYGMPLSNIKFDTKKLENKVATDETETKTVVAKKDPEEYLPYGTFPMEFVIEGKYDDFVSFLNDLEHNLRLIDIEGISFKVPEIKKGDKPEENIDPNIYSYTLKTKIYWLRQ